MVHDAHKHLHIQTWDEVVKKKNREERDCSQYASINTSLEKYVAVIRARHGSFRHILTYNNQKGKQNKSNQTENVAKEKTDQTKHETALGAFKWLWSVYVVYVSSRLVTGFHLIDDMTDR